MKRFSDLATRIVSGVKQLESMKLSNLESSLNSVDQGINRFSRRLSQFYQKRKSVDFSRRLADRADELSQAILQTDTVASLSATKIVGLAGASLPTSLGFGMASLFGTAGTGAAIGSLSGAAATSASLAWIGGSVASGGLLLLVTGLAAGVGSAHLARKFVVEKWIGQSRRATRLSSREHKSIEALGVLADFMRNRGRLGNLSNLELSVLRKTVNTLRSDLAYLISGYGCWPNIPKQRVYKALALFDSAITEVLGNKHSDRQIDIAIGSFSASLVSLLSDPHGIPDKDADEYLIIEAVRLSKTDLDKAPDGDVISYIRDLDDDQMSGLISSIKGKYFELLFARRESSDDDNVTARLFDSTNHEGSDIQLVDIETGEILEEIQLKATDYLSYIREHQRKYEDITVYATSEVASEDDSIIDTGISNDSLTKNVEHLFTAVRDEGPHSGIADSIALSMTVGCALELKRIADGAPIDRSFSRSLIRQGASAALVSAVLSAM